MNRTQLSLLFVPFANRFNTFVFGERADFVPEFYGLRKKVLRLMFLYCLVKKFLLNKRDCVS